MFGGGEGPAEGAGGGERLQGGGSASGGVEGAGGVRLQGGGEGGRGSTACRSGLKRLRSCGTKAFGFT